MSTILKRLGNLLCVKSIVTIMLTAVFSYLTLSGHVTGQDFLTVFSVVIAFYFGTQSQRLNDLVDKDKSNRKPDKVRHSKYSEPAFGSFQIESEHR